MSDHGVTFKPFRRDPVDPVDHDYPAEPYIMLAPWERTLKRMDSTREAKLLEINRKRRWQRQLDRREQTMRGVLIAVEALTDTSFDMNAWGSRSLIISTYRAAARQKTVVDRAIRALDRAIILGMVEWLPDYPNHVRILPAGRQFIALTPFKVIK